METTDGLETSRFCAWIDMLTQKIKEIGDNESRCFEELGYKEQMSIEMGR